MAVTSQDFKSALRQWASGVTVVAVTRDALRHGMTVSSFASVSLEPPLISICLDRATRAPTMIEITRQFAVSVLAADQAAVSNHFASPKTAERRFEGQVYSVGVNGCALLGGVAAHLECSVFALHEAGDHVLVVGEVQRVEVFDRAPLLYGGGSYGAFAPLA
jgi:flavin reductase (DIM6/NTAB) family NADH-FMN oxidoreductase RutF